MLVEEGADVLPGDAPHRRRRAEGVAPERVLGEERRLPPFRGQVGGLVGVHEDLVEDDGALGLDVVGAQRRLPHDVAQDVEAERQVLGEQPHVEGRVLLGGEGVAVAADLVELFGDGRGGAPFGALEEQVLQEVRGPGEFAGLVTRAGADPVGDRDRADIRHGLGDQADAARQDGRLDQRRRERPREGRRSPPRSPPRSPRSLPASAAPGPRSPRSATSSASKASSKEAPSAVAVRAVAVAGADEDDDPEPEPDERADEPDRSPVRRPPLARARARGLRSTLGRRGQRQRHLALRVDVVDPDLDRLAQRQHVLDVVDALATGQRGQFRNVQQAVPAGQHVHEGTELGDVDHLAG